MIGQPFGKERMGYVQAETRRGWGLGGSPEGDRRGLSLVAARWERPMVRSSQSVGGVGAVRGADLETLSRRHGVTVATLSAWREDFLAGGEAGLKRRAVQLEDEDTRRLKSVVAELATDKELLKEKIRHLEGSGPLAGGGRSDESPDVALHSPAVRDCAGRARVGDPAFHVLRTTDPAGAAGDRTTGTDVDAR